MAEPTAEILSGAIKKIQELRASVACVFGRLSEGVNDSKKSQGGENEFLSELKQNLLAVNRDFSEIEKISMGLASPVTLSLGNSGMLTQDPVLDKSPRYSQLLQSYKWTNKMHDYAAMALTLLNQNQLKRSVAMQQPGPMKKQRKVMTTGHTYPQQNLEQFVQQLGNIHPNLSINLTRPMGNAPVLVITLGHTMKAVVVLRGLLIEWVSVKAVTEETTNNNGQVDIWSRSKYQVFQKVSEHATIGMLHFQHPLKPDIALKSFVQWFSAYNTLFTAPCTKCGTHLMDNLPPTWRDLRKAEPYHEACRPQTM